MSREVNNEHLVEVIDLIVGILVLKVRITLGASSLWESENL
jgi:hypothetical protein